MFRQGLMHATLAGAMLVATGAFAATPAVPKSTAIANPAVEQAAYWWRGRSYPYRWHGGYWMHRRWEHNAWRYW